MLRLDISPQYKPDAQASDTHRQYKSDAQASDTHPQYKPDAQASDTHCHQNVPFRPEGQDWKNRNQPCFKLPDRIASESICRITRLRVGLV